MLRRVSSRIGRSVLTLPLAAIAAILVFWVTESAHRDSTASLESLGQRAIARCLRISRDSVRDYLMRAAALNVRWPLPDEMDDAAI